MLPPRWVFYPLLFSAAWALLAFLAHRGKYFPLRFPQGDWEAQRLVGADEVTFAAADGTRLSAWWVKPPSARLAVLLLHGNAGNVTYRAGHLSLLPRLGAATLVVDYRGYGKSEGSPSESGLYQDATAAYNWLRSQGWPPEKIVLHGESLGTAVAVELATRVPCAGLILEAPFTSARDVARRVLPGLGALIMWGFDSKSRIPSLRVPLLILHGDRDDIISIDLGRALFAAATGDKQFVALPGAGHNDILETGAGHYRKAVEDFFSRY